MAPTRTPGGTRPSGRRFGAAIAGLTLLLASCGSTGGTASADDTTDPGVVLVDLTDTGEAAAWTTVNDPVMGGRSTSSITASDAGLVFSGTLSLENNGGFASVRSPQDPEIGRRATGTTALRVRAVGDGKTYLLRAGAAGQTWSYVQRFRTEAGIPRTYDLPVPGFQPVGMRLDPAPEAPPTLDPSTISQVSVYILDKQQGPFTLTLSGIDAAA